MKRTVLALTLATFAAAAPEAAAIDLGLGILKRRPRNDAADKVKQLVTTLQSDPDEKHRLAAVGELAGFDTRNHKDVVPTLISSMQKDPAPAVRAEAAESLGKIKPVTQQAALALEAVQSSDPAQSVRDAAKSALFQYHLNGYRSTSTQGATQSEEPPLATPRPMLTTLPTKPLPVKEPSFTAIPNAVGKGVFSHQTVEPPLAKPKSEPLPIPVPVPAATPPIPQPQPQPMPAISAPPTIAVPPLPPTITPPPLATPGSGF